MVILRELFFFIWTNVVRLISRFASLLSSQSSQHMDGGERGIKFIIMKRMGRIDISHDSEEKKSVT